MTTKRQRLGSYLKLFGFDYRRTLDSSRRIWLYRREMRAFQRQRSAEDAFPLGESHPCLDDRFQVSGLLDAHYFHQDLLVARRICERNPRQHVDVGSRIDGFVAHVASYRPIVVIDIRPQPVGAKNVGFLQADLMEPLPPSLLESCDSLSCLHALEHFGLGRYGDRIDPAGYLVGIDNLCKVLEPEGRLYLSVPIGLPQRVEFNAHRVFSLAYLLSLVADRFVIDDFSYIDDGGTLHEGVGLTPEGVETSFGCRYGCGILDLTKK